MRTVNIGKNVCLVEELPYLDSWGYNDDSDNEYRLFDKQLKKNQYKHCIAITANKFQKDTRKVLEKNGFKPAVNFYSAHNHKSETLTIWYKNRRDFKESGHNLNHAGDNCSVSVNEEDDDCRNVCDILVESKGRTKAQLKKLGYKKIAKSPIWVDIEKKYQIKKK